jgi:carboxyl-terminal processing protease
MDKPKLKLRQPLSYAIILAFGMFLGTKMTKNMTKKTYDFNAKIGELSELLKKNYVDSINVDSVFNNYLGAENKIQDSIQELTIEKILAQLDPHSIYIPPVQLKSVNEEMRGDFAGVGVEYNIINDTINVTYVVPNGPAEKEQIMIGDQLIKVGDTTVAGVKINTERIRAFLRGMPNSKVHITILREKQLKKMTITRGVIQIPSLDASYMINETTGFLKLNKFSLTSYEEFKTSLEKLKAQGMTQLIFDLRGNGGGILSDAVAIVDEFLDGDKLVVYTEGVHQKKETYKCSKPGLFEKGKLVLLIDEMSASASEIVAGALQDWDRATIVGRRSFGKGLVQRQFGFADNSAARITVARYYTPTGRSIQKSYKEGNEKYHNELSNRYENGGLLNADSNKAVNGKVYKTNAGKLVYGGGGITPDYFVALDTSVKYFGLFTKLYQNNTLNNFVFSYYKQNKPSFNQYKNIQAFVDNFSISPAIWNQFKAYCTQQKITVDTITVTQQNYISDRLVQLFARQLYRSNGVFEVLNKKDTIVQKAMEVLK